MQIQASMCKHWPDIHGHSINKLMSTHSTAHPPRHPCTFPKSTCTAGNTSRDKGDRSCQQYSFLQRCLYEAIAEKPEASRILISTQCVIVLVCTKTVTQSAWADLGILQVVAIMNLLPIFTEKQNEQITILPLFTVLVTPCAQGTFCTKVSACNKYNIRRKQAEPLQRYLHMNYQKLYKEVVKYCHNLYVTVVTFFLRSLARWNSSKAAKRHWVQLAASSLPEVVILEIWQIKPEMQIALC